MRIPQEQLDAASSRFAKELFVYMMACISASGLSHLEIAQALRIPLSVLRERLMDHHNWDLNLVSDLCLAIGVEMNLKLVDRSKE